jgi:hypothetical protein
MRRAGATVMELLITLGIILIVAAITSLLLLRTTRATIRGTLRVEMQQQGVLAMQRILGDMRKSACTGISLRSGADPRAIGICTLSQPGRRSGEPPPQQLRYREWPPGSVSATSLETSIANSRRLAPARLAQVLTGSAPRETIVVSGVTDFRLSYPPSGSDDLYIQPLTIQIVQERRGNTGHSQPERFTYTRTIFLPEQR